MSDFSGQLNDGYNDSLSLNFGAFLKSTLLRYLEVCITKVNFCESFLLGTGYVPRLATWFIVTLQSPYILLLKSDFTTIETAQRTGQFQ